MNSIKNIDRVKSMSNSLDKINWKHSIREFLHDGYIDMKYYTKHLIDYYQQSLLLNGLVNLIDRTGGINSGISVLAKKMEALETQRINYFLDKLQNQIDLLDMTKIDKDFVNSEEFVEILFKILDKAKREFREHKFEYYSNIFLNSCTTTYSNSFYKENVIETISKYSVEHIIVLGKVYEMYLSSSEKNKFTFEKNDIQIDGLEKETILICLNTLMADGILEKTFWEPLYITQFGLKCIELIQVK